MLQSPHNGAYFLNLVDGFRCLVRSYSYYYVCLHVNFKSSTSYLDFDSICNQSILWICLRLLSLIFFPLYVLVQQELNIGSTLIFTQLSFYMSCFPCSSNQQFYSFQIYCEKGFTRTYCYKNGEQDRLADRAEWRYRDEEGLCP